MLINDSEAWKVILADSDQMTIEQVERILETRFQTEFSLFHAPSAEIAERYLSVIQPRIIFLNYLLQIQIWENGLSECPDRAINLLSYL